MNKINLKVVIIVLGVLALISIVYIIYKIQQNKTAVPRGERFQQSINVPNYFQGTNLPITNNIKSSDFNFPSSLPYLQTSSTGFNTGTANAVANKMGFTGEPITFQDIQNGSVMIWNGENYTLTAKQKSGEIQLTSNLPTETLVANAEDKSLSDDDLKNIASSFLNGRAGLDPTQTKFIGFSYFKQENGVENLAKTDKGGAEVIQLNYYQSTSPYPILTQNPDLPQIWIQLLKDGSIYSFTANLGYNFQESQTEYPLKNYTQFSAEIGSSVLVSLNNGNINIPDLSSTDINTLQINSVSLAYLLDFGSQGILQPVFLLEGKASVNGFSTPVDVSLYLPAFEGLSQP